MAEKVYHWKHGWIPVDQAAAADRFSGDPDKFYGGDKLWQKASVFDLPAWDDLVAQAKAKDRWGNDPIKQAWLDPNEKLISTQDFVYPETVAKYEKRVPTGLLHDLPQVYRSPSGNTYVFNGHHRILADRRQGRQSKVQVLDGRPGGSGLTEAAKRFGQ